MASSNRCSRIAVTWRIVALATPHLRRHCPSCSGPRAFRSSDKFRVNANQRRLDVWLVYRCVDCDATWNRTVVERARPDSLRPDDYRAYLRNDVATAWRTAFAATAVPTMGDVPIRIDRPALPATPYRIAFDMTYLCDARLDRVVARELGLSRAGLARRIASGAVRTPDGSRRAWRRAIGVDTVVQIDPA